MPKQRVLHLLRDRGASGTATRAERELPERVDTDRDAELLATLGVTHELVTSLRGNLPPMPRQPYGRAR